MSRATRVPKTTCPWCGRTLTGAFDATDDDPREPVEGDLTICLYCGSECVYGAGMQLRKPEPGELTPEDLVLIERAQFLRAGGKAGEN